jgi:hypothetical protein
MRVVTGRPATLSWVMTNQARARVAPDDGQPLTVVVVDGAGVEVSSGDAVNEGNGTVTYKLPAQTRCDRLIALLTATVEGDVRTERGVVDVVGARLLPDELVLDEGTLAKLSPSRLDGVLASVEVGFRDIIGTPVIPEGARTIWWHTSSYGAGGGFDGPPTVTGQPYGSGFSGGRLRIPGIAEPLELYELATNAGQYLTGDLQLLGVEDGALQWTDGRGWVSGRYKTWLAHGFAFPEPDLVDVGLIMARYLARRLPRPGRNNPSLLPERTASFTADNATIVFARPGSDQPTGLPEVDAILTRYRSERVI